MENPNLIDREELYKMFPALKGRGKSIHNRINWLIRTRQLAGMIRLGRRIFFDPEKIREWIRQNEIPVKNDK